MALGARRPLTVVAWLAVPLLFVAAVLGLTGLGGLLLDAEWRVTLSSLLWGPAAAVTALLAPGVDWRSPRHRYVVGAGYPLLVFGAGLVLSDVELPVPVAMTVGLPALAILVVMLARDHNRAIPIA